MPTSFNISNFSFSDTTWETGDIIPITFDLQNTGSEDLSSRGIQVNIGNENIGVSIDSIDTPEVLAGQTATITGSIIVHDAELPAGDYVVNLRYVVYGSPNVTAYSSNIAITTSGIQPFSIHNDNYETSATGTYDALAGDDAIWGSEFDETFYGNDGNDTIHHDGGDDIVFGGNGDDTIRGYFSIFDGNNSITTLPGSNEIYGGVGNDYVNTYSLNDTIEGGEGDDTFDIWQIEMTQAEADLNSGNIVHGGEGNDIVNSYDGVGYAIGSTIYGDAGDDMISSNNASDVIFGGGGADTIDLALDPLVAIVLARQSSFTGDGGYANGGSGADKLLGSSLDDQLLGGKGTDKIKGAAGADEIIGGKGADRLFGQRDNDDVSGGKGDDKIFGNAGEDKLSGNNGADKLYGGSSADEIYGNKGDDAIKGGSGDDLISGGKGDDKLVGGLGIDTFIFATGDGDDIIKDFEDGVDFIQINATLASTGALIVEEQGAHTLVSFEDVSILIKYVDYTQITLEDFVF